MRTRRFHSVLLLILLVAGPAVVACSPIPSISGQASAEELRSNQPRISVQPPEGDLRALTEGNTAFALDLYHALGGEGNLFFSPHSISTALAMTYAGAATTTARQMRSTLHVTLPDERLHAAFNALDRRLASHEQQAEQDQPSSTPFTLRQANALWGQRGHPFRPAFLDRLAQHYGAGLSLVDFAGAPEPARARINDWVAEQTEQKIRDLMPEGSVTSSTQLVLANAIYFKAKWRSPFDEMMTRDDPFTRLDGTTVTAALMDQTGTFKYADGADYQAVQLDYHGDVAMIVLLPPLVQFTAFESALTPERLHEILDGLEPRQLRLKLPKIKYTSPNIALKSTLEGLGMVDAFTVGGDFSGMDGTGGLFIDDVHHKATLVVDEEGTEAAAATGVAMTGAEAEQVEMVVDHPFILLIRDQPTGAILFAGRIVDPRP